MAQYAHTPSKSGNYADKGYQKDGKYRYPLDTAEHARAAWSYINMPRNSSKYNPADLAKVKNAIRAACKRFGIDIADKTKSSITTAEVSTVHPKIVPPDSTATHFFTAGRMITYNEPNLNGLVFFKTDCHPVLDTLKNSLADISHVKPGNDVPATDGQTNKTIGSVFEIHEDDEGIDIVCKNDRDATLGMGFNEDDFKPIDGTYSSYSQESDFSPNSSPVIAVRPGVRHNIDPNKDIVYEMHPDEAKARGLSTSYYNANLNKWVYNTDEDGNTLFIRLKPISFSGVGHVMDPADENAMVYSYAACVDGERIISQLYPRELSDTYPSMDDPGYLPPGPEAMATGGSVFDQGGAGDDFIKHPDLSEAGKNYFAKEDDDNDYPDEAYAALYYGGDDDDGNLPFKSSDPTQPHTDYSDYSKKRLFRVKDKNGEFNRPRLIAAYQSLTGMRGNTVLSKKLPPLVAHHALAVIRQGLEKTKPKERHIQMSEISNPVLDRDIAALEERARILSQERETATAAYQTLSNEFSEYKSTNEELVNTYKTELDTLKGELQEFKDKALSTERLLTLEKIFPYSDEEKAKEEFPEFVKSLASISEDRLETLLVRRELEKAKSERNKSLSSFDGGKLSPVPTYDNGVYVKPSIVDIL